MPAAAHDPRTPLIRKLEDTGRVTAKLNETQQSCLARLKQAIETGELMLDEADCISGTTCNQGVLIAKQDRYGLPFRTYLCPNSGLMWTSPKFTPESSAKFYADFYRELYLGKEQATQDFFDEQVKHGEEVLAFVSSEVRPSEKLSAFDIGCGAGGMLLPFQRAKFSAHGCDLGPKYLELGRQAGIDLREGDFASLSSLPKASLVMASHVLEHTPDPGAQIRGWANLVEDGGLLYIEVPGIFKAYDNYREFSRFVHLAHTYHFTLDTLAALVEAEGFKLIKGDESVRALFRKTGVPGEKRATAAIADDIVAYLNRWQTPMMAAVNRVRRPLLKLKRSAGRLDR